LASVNVRLAKGAKGMARTITILIGVIIIAGALYFALPQYQIIVGENQSIAWRINTHTGELAVCTSPDLPAAGCKSLPGSSAGYLPSFVSDANTGSAPQQSNPAAAR
jgi:hypothetical protein